MPDKFSAVWVSHSSISDFLKCPRSYYLKNIYKDPNTGNKVQVISPPLTLGTAVHEVVEALSAISTRDRFKESLLEKFEKVWKKYSGKKGGFLSEAEEEDYKNQGREMIRKIIKNPGPLKSLSVKMKEDLPFYWLSEEDNIILCGKIDWLEYLPDSDGVHVIDFKTSKKEEDEDSLQLPIYHLLVANIQNRKVEKASYWYLRLSDELQEKKLPDLDEAKEKILTIAKKIKTAKKLNVFKCPEGDKGCFACKPMEAVIRGEAEYLGVGGYKRDIYLFSKENNDNSSEIL
ncbi:PD-(D/E)XK nuclease family protein [Candidatus Woesebacteria bacterium]|nr:PD-(D/E)XK nuclease family protein [Candidatus Woesebacteria bacterium]